MTQPHKPIVNSLSDISAQALGELLLWFQQNPPIIPVANIQGLPNVVTGSVNANGSIAAGSGFTVSHGGTGVYTVTFGTGRAFSADPNVKLTVAANQPMSSPELTAVSGSAFTAVFVDPGNVAADCAFQFEARPTS